MKIPALLSLKTIRKRVAKFADSGVFDVDQARLDAIDDLERWYGVEGKNSAKQLDAPETVAKLVIERALEHLITLRYYYRKPVSSPSPIQAKFIADRKRWWLSAYGFIISNPGRRDFNYLGPQYHPEVTGDELADRFINETAIHLAQAYDESLPEDSPKRDIELDGLVHGLAFSSPNFAEKLTSNAFLQHRVIANTYRQVDATLYALGGECPVDVIEKLLQEEEKEQDRCKKVGDVYDQNEVKVTTTNGVSHRSEDIRYAINHLAKMPTLGPWETAKDPSKAVALSRGIASLGQPGIAFTVNIDARIIHPAEAHKRNTASVLQDNLRRELAKEFGTSPDFFFTGEQTVGGKPHLHGAVALEATEENIKRLRTALYSFSKSKRPRRVDAQPLKTPGRWGAYTMKLPAGSALKTGLLLPLCKTQHATRQAKVEWERMRAEQRSAREALKLMEENGT